MKNLMRSHIHDLVGYSSARDEFTGEASVFLDANENPYNTAYNRYPDSRQRAVRDLLADHRGIDAKQIYLGNGSDSIVDQLIRIFCTPGEDQILMAHPSFPMYAVMASINQVAVHRVDKLTDYQLDVPAMKSAIDAVGPKIVFICSPNNPTSIRLHPDDIHAICAYNPGITVVDEAYIDFDPEYSLLPYLDRYPRLVILQTMSKSWGLAGIRIGMCIAQPYLIDRLYTLSTPYNVNVEAQRIAAEYLAHPETALKNLSAILEEKPRIGDYLSSSSLFDRVLPSAANFWVVRSDRHQEIYDVLADRGIIVRNLHKSIPHFLRITIGTPAENDLLIDALNSMQ